MKSIRWKLMAGAFLIVLIPVYFLNRYATETFDRFTSRALEEEMIGHAFMLGEQYRTMAPGSGGAGADDAREEFGSLLRRCGPEVQSRLRILSPKGVVLFDSGTNSTVGADLSERREIARAKQGAYGARWQLTDDRKLVYYYSALPVMDGGKVAGIAYVTRHTGRITKAIRTMIRNQRVAMIVAAIFALLVSALLAQTVTRRLRKLTAASIEYARGNAGLDLRIRGRDEIGTLARAVTFMAEEIEKRNEYNRDFVSTVMHELKTPVTAIKGAVEVLEAGAMDKEDARRKFMGNIRYEADRLTRMVGELGELTRLDVEVLRGQKEKTDYCACVREILDRILPTFDEDHARFSASLPDEPVMTMIMPDRIEQVIANLLENAFRYTPASGNVALLVVVKGDDVLTSVKDTGPGIPPASLPKVFDRFYTTERKDVPKEYGSGLGLAIAKSIVENHQGGIRVESVQGQGACFTFSLPIAKS